MAILDCLPPPARAEALEAIRPLIGTPAEVKTAIEVMRQMIVDWGATPANAAGLTQALFEAARGETQRVL